MKNLKTLRSSLLTLALAMVLTMTTSITAFAASFPGPNGMSGDINRGATTVTLPDGSTVQVTDMLVAKEQNGGGIDANETVYVIFRSGDLYIYNHKYQNTVNIIKVDTDVVSFKHDTNGYVSGWIKADGTEKSVLTDAEVQAKINGSSSGGSSSGGSNSGSSSSGGSNNSSSSGGNNNSSSGGTNNSSSTNYTNAKISVGNNKVTFTLGGKTYTLVNNPLLESAYYDAATGTVYIKYTNGEGYIWNYDLQKNESTPVLHKMPNSISSWVINNGKIAGWYEVGNSGMVSLYNSSQIRDIVNGSDDLKVGNNSVTFTRNGKTYTLVSNNSLLESAYYDAATGTVYIKYLNGELYIWNYELQKEETTPKLHKLSSNVTSLVVNNNKLAGWYQTGKTGMVSLLTSDQIKQKISGTSSTSYKYAQRAITKKYKKKTTKVLKDSNNDRKDIATWKHNGKLVYHGRVFKNVRFAEFNSVKGHLCVITKKGNLYVIDKETLSAKKIASGVTKFSFTKNGLARYAVRKSGTRFKITSY